MDFAEIDFASFSEVLKSMKQEIENELKKNPKLDDESQVLLESINILLKEIKGVASYQDLDLERKKKVLPHLSLVFVFTRSLYEDEDSDFDDEEDAEWDFSAECGEGECTDEESQGKKSLPMSSHGCCGGHDHHHPTPPKGKK